MTFLASKMLYWLFALPFLAGLKLWADWRARKVQAVFTAPRLRLLYAPYLRQLVRAFRPCFARKHPHQIDGLYQRTPGDQKHE